MATPGKRFLSALDVHLSLIDFWRRGPGVQFAESYLANEERKRNHGDFRFSSAYGPDGDIPASWVMAKAESGRLDTAETYWVSADMVDVIDSLAGDLPDAPLHPMDLPSPSGFALLEKSVYVEDLNEETVGVRAVLWAPTVVNIQTPDGTMQSQGVAVSFYSATQDEGDTGLAGIPDKVRQSMPRFVLLSTGPWLWSTAPEDDPDAPAERESGRVQVPVWKEGAEGEMIPSYDPLTGMPEWPQDPSLRLYPSMGDELGSFLVGLWRLSTQTITRVSRMPADRPTRRMLERKGRTPEWGDIRVVDLRKER